MGLVIKKTIAILAIFLVVPLVIIAINWHWQPTSLNNTSKYLFLVTETASFPWAIITSAILFLVFYLLLPNKTKIILLWLLLVSAILSGQIIKSLLKSQTTESRPYVLWMADEFNITDQQFYSLTDLEKKEIIYQLLNNSTTIPSWLSKHWQHETGYSFPSGHTLFAVTWAFLALMLLKFKQHYIIITSAIIWSILIEISRLLLGMHRPIDLITSILIAWIISLICYFYAKKWHIVDK
ncbi:MULTISPECIES: phosphatase PAP2 family protein [unclassified Gilliamella]|uniref:phosphatase PAP2 family protein n=1 Tax=unclassified Gilliamella TaxID=2685620 RepID=UPI00130B1B58|nr:MULTISPECIES: phosphatase PAP2 family protein [unclassified Gilliamella]MWP50178.1 phosphatase PAP2 family protein [Gilliamella sp. Lep-s35]MWP69925.1 phosphatase PAP2 family protein [Gilliamella sp. Lep-s5]MWP78183.1 phosphatase PAP2 family protein [Gilliamella sp. Lep-s21]